jgi:hypothetical protein
MVYIPSEPQVSRILLSNIFILVFRLLGVIQIV